MAYSIRSLLLCAAAIAFLLATPSYAHSFLRTNDTLQKNEALSQGAYRFIMQSDCNLVLYDNKKHIWATNTTGKGNNCSAIMMDDGNLSIYNQLFGIQIFVWQSGWLGGHGEFILLLQLDRNVAIYTLPKYQGIWETNTCILRTTDTISYRPQNSTDMK